MEKKQIKKINLNGLEKVLSPKEMKNVVGGGSGCCCADGQCEVIYRCDSDGGCSAWGSGGWCLQGC